MFYDLYKKIANPIEERLKAMVDLPADKILDEIVNESILNVLDDSLVPFNPAMTPLPGISCFLNLIQTSSTDSTLCPIQTYSPNMECTCKLIQDSSVHSNQWSEMGSMIKLPFLGMPGLPYINV